MNSKQRYVRSALSTVDAVIAFTVTASNAFAAPPIDPRTARTENLTLAGLDLSQSADLQIARDRIRQKAQIDCVAHATVKAEPQLEQLAAAQTANVTLAALQR